MNSWAAELGQTATQVPQPMQAAASKAVSAMSLAEREYARARCLPCYFVSMGLCLPCWRCVCGGGLCHAVSGGVIEAHLQ